MTSWKFELGDRVKDRVTGHEGIVVIRNEHLNGCKQYAVAPELGKDGKMLDTYNIDGEQLEKIDDGLNKDKPIKKKQTGGAPTVIKPSVVQELR